VSAFSVTARSADGQPWRRERYQPAGPLRVRPSPPAVGPAFSGDCRAILGWRARREILPGFGFILPGAEAERFAAAVPSARVVEIDANHYTITTHDDSIAAVGAFLRTS
jgi:hypothetical protein